MQRKCSATLHQSIVTMMQKLCFMLNFAKGKLKLSDEMKWWTYFLCYVVSPQKKTKLKVSNTVLLTIFNEQKWHQEVQLFRKFNTLEWLGVVDTDLNTSFHIQLYAQGQPAVWRCLKHSPEKYNSCSHIFALTAIGHITSHSVESNSKQEGWEFVINCHIFFS